MKARLLRDIKRVIPDVIDIELYNGYWWAIMPVGKYRAWTKVSDIL